MRNAGVIKLLDRAGDEVELLHPIETYVPLLVSEDRFARNPTRILKALVQWDDVALAPHLQTVRRNLSPIQLLITRVNRWLRISVKFLLALLQNCRRFNRHKIWASERAVDFLEGSLTGFALEQRPIDEWIGGRSKSEQVVLALLLSQVDGKREVRWWTWQTRLVPDHVFDVLLFSLWVQIICYLSLHFFHLGPICILLRRVWSRQKKQRVTSHTLLGSLDCVGWLCNADGAHWRHRVGLERFRAEDRGECVHICWLQRVHFWLLNVLFFGWKN